MLTTIYIVVKGNVDYHLHCIVKGNVDYHLHCIVEGNVDYQIHCIVEGNVDYHLHCIYDHLHRTCESNTMLTTVYIEHCKSYKLTVIYLQLEIVGESNIR